MGPRVLRLWVSDTHGRKTAVIRWCAYCQRYQGETWPYDDYSVTHTICDACEAHAADFVCQPARIEAIQRFFQRVLRTDTMPGPNAAELVAEGAALGIGPVDLLLGIVQPVLRRIGDRWARSEATIAEEHQVSARCSAIVDLLVHADPSLAQLRQAPHPEALLVAAEGNFHTLGLRVIEAYLVTHRISTFTVYPGLPAGEVVELAQRLSPRLLAISAALSEHVLSAVDVARRLATWPSGARPEVVVGGFALRSDTPSLPPDAPLVACSDLRVLLELAQKHGAARALES
jgi:methanogenic corrinoid protein MtbC1